MRKVYQSEIPNPLVSEGECIEYTAINGMVFHVLAVANDESISCHGCAFYKFKNDRSVVGNGRYICDCGPNGENSLCYKGQGLDVSKGYCRFVDMDSIMEKL